MASTLAHKVLTVGIVCLLAIGNLHATTKSDASYDPEVVRLATIDCFAFGGVGYEGGISQGEKLFQNLIRKEEASRYLVAVFERGTPEARCYALVGLREASPEFYYAAEAKFLRNPPDKISVMSGCILSDQAVDDVVDRIRRGHYAVYFRAAQKR